MREKLLYYICCKECSSEFELNVFHHIKDHVIDGLLQCHKCNNVIFIVSGIPRFVSLNILKHDNDFLNFIDTYKNRKDNIFESYLKDTAITRDATSLEKIKNDTSKYFGFEWDYFKDWGWIPDDSVSEEKKEYEYFGGLISHTERAFKTKCMLTEEDLASERVILDAGCGNGRFTKQAAKHNGTVVGVDLGYGVKSAYNNLKDSPNVHIAQADLFNLPFKEGIFDSVFSNGVLMHTGDAKKAFTSITKHVKQGGVLVAHLYHKRNIIFEIVDASLRYATTKISVEQNMKFAQLMANWGKKLKKKGTWKKWFKFVEILPTTIHMYDWYSAQIATHHTYSEVLSWFTQAGFDIIKSNEPPKEHITFLNKPESLTIKGRKTV